MVTEIITSTPFMLSLVLLSYLLGTYIYTRSRVALLHPVLISIAVCIGVLSWLDVDYETFKRGSYLIDFLLGPSVVALGYVLYEQVANIRGKVVSILTSVTVGAVVGVGSVILLCKLLGCEDLLIVSLESKSVTTPIAISLSERSGGVVALTTIAVVISGILGSIIGPWVLRRAGVKSRTATGLALGSAAHGIGTARAVEIGAIEGAVSGLAIGLMGVATSLLMPLIDHLLLH